MFINYFRACPNDFKKAIASLVFTAPRLPRADTKKTVTASAVELCLDYGVNRQVAKPIKI